jgi:hypothetical protein
MRRVKTTGEDANWVVAWRWGHYFDSRERRPLVISPYYGCYGLAGYVIAINGSPVRGYAVVDLDYREQLGHHMILKVEFRKKVTKHLPEVETGKSDRFYEDTVTLLRCLNLPCMSGGSAEPEVVTLYVDDKEVESYEKTDGPMEVFKEPVAVER